MKREFKIALIVLLVIGGAIVAYTVLNKHPSRSAEQAQSADRESEDHREDADNEHADAAKPDDPDHGNEEHGHGDEEEHADKTEISDDAASNMQIEVLAAGRATVQQTINLAGKITLNQNRTAQIKARFPGIVKDVKKSIGEKVNAGETLATVESNNSLQTYPVKAPFAGTVLERNVSAGDMAETETMFTVADLSHLWAEFFIFSRDIDRIKPDQKVDVQSMNDSTSTTGIITSVLPTAETASQTVVARVVIDNADNRWRSGMTVRGDVVLSEREVPLAVKSTAIQRQEGANVVYIKKGSSYEMRKVELGEADREWTEILSGVWEGENYVATNSFVVKADIGKSSAEHEH